MIRAEEMVTGRRRYRQPPGVAFLFRDFCARSIAGASVLAILAALALPVCAAEDLGSLVASIQALQNDTDKAFPFHLTKGAPKNGTEFDANGYFRLFRHIAPPEGKVLDYVFCGGVDGRPVMYWRGAKDVAHKTCAGLKRARTQTDIDALASLLILDAADDAYFELLIFTLLADKFYLGWHAGYAELDIAVTKQAVEDIVKKVNASGFGRALDERQAAAARVLDVAPAIDLSDPRAVTVSLVTFSKWRGFVRVTRKIARLYPHVVLDEKSEVLLEYNCGVMF